MPTILAVDNERPILALISEILRAEHTVITAESGTEALALYASYSSQIDLLLTDVEMPGMSGPELVARLGKLFVRPLPIIFVTGGPGLDLEASQTVVRKPFSPSVLKETIKRALQGA